MEASVALGHRVYALEACSVSTLDMVFVDDLFTGVSTDIGITRTNRRPSAACLLTDE